MTAPRGEDLREASSRCSLVFFCQLYLSPCSQNLNASLRKARSDLNFFDVMNSKTMARSLAAVLREKNALQRRNQELENAGPANGRLMPVTPSGGPFVCSLVAPGLLTPAHGMLAWQPHASERVAHQHLPAPTIPQHYNHKRIADGYAHCISGHHLNCSFSSKSHTRRRTALPRPSLPNGSIPVDKRPSPFSGWTFYGKRTHMHARMCASLRARMFACARVREDEHRVTASRSSMPHSRASSSEPQGDSAPRSDISCLLVCCLRAAGRHPSPAVSCNVALPRHTRTQLPSGPAWCPPPVLGHRQN